ncbi:MAG: GNAT family N-acetyltransferase [Pseudomonadota bacterium]
MSVTPRLVTPRLHLRGWTEPDLARLAEINADPEVMAHLGGPLAREMSDLLVGRFLQKWAEEPRFGWWALERTGAAELIGFVGLGRPDFDKPPAPCVEIGWRLKRSAWGQGFATEAARACLAHAFDTVGLTEVLSFTTPDNARSRLVMERLGMEHDPAGDFDHPLVAEDSPLRRHVLYRLRISAWAGAR